ncbi:MAG: DNA polymerase III subunit delta [Vigna little leaf phytoplasma]|nr:DNA polymerase III subunit delta [Vigna little leaf phytoplasma]
MKIYPLNLFICPQLFFIEQKKKLLQKICQKYNYHFIEQSLEKDNYENILTKLKQELLTNSFLFQKKLILINNISFLFNQKNIDLKFLINYFKNPRNDIIIYLTEIKENNFPLDIKKNLINLFHIEKKKLLQTKDLFKYIENLFIKDNFDITSKLINKLAEKTNNNLFWLHENINKIKIYHLPRKKIEDPKIFEILIPDEENNIFLFIKYLIKNNYSIKTLIFFENLIKQKKNDIFIIIHQIIRKLQDIIITKNLLNTEYTQEKIATILKYSSSQIYFFIKEIQTLEIEKIKKLFIFFTDLYYEIKQGLKEAKTSLEMFLINQIVNYNIEKK